MPELLQRPEIRPPAGLTVSAQGIRVCPSHLLVTLTCGAEITLQLTNCFSRDKNVDRWTLHEQSILEAAVAAAIKREGCFYVTLPMPQRSLGWWDSINSKTVPFAGYLWIDSKTTIQQVLIATGNRSETPWQPTIDCVELPAPKVRPIAGLTAPVKIMASARRADSWWVQFDGAFEILTQLLDCYTEPIVNEAGIEIEAGIAAYQRASQYLYWENASLACTLPMTTTVKGWWHNLRNRTTQAGWLWITEEHTLNDILVRQKLATSKPSTKASKNDRRCA